MSRPPSPPRRLFFAVALVLAVLAPEGWSTNSNRYVATAHAILLEGRLAIDTWRGTTIDTSFANGHWFAGAAPAPNLLVLPGYVLFRAAVWPLVPDALAAKVGRTATARLSERSGSSPSGFDLAEFALSVQFLTWLVPPLVGAALAVALYGWFRRRDGDRRRALLLALVSLFGTTAFHYSTVIFSHVLAGLSAFVAFRLVVEDDDGAGRFRPVAAGLLAAGAVASDYLAAAATVAVALFALARLAGRRRALFLAGLAAGGALLAGWQWAAFGAPWLTPYHFPSGAEGAADSHAPVLSGFFGMDRPRVGVILELLFGARRGYFFHMPILLLALVGLVDAARGRCRREDRPPALLSLAIFAAFLLFNGSMASEFLWTAGTSFGPRYLVPTIPFVAAGLAFLRWDRPAVRQAAVVMGALSLFVNLLGALFGPSDLPSRAPFFDRFLPLLAQFGPQPTLVRNLGTMTGASPATLAVSGTLLLLLALAAAAAILAPALRSPAPEPATAPESKGDS